MLNFTKQTMAKISADWGVKVHAEPPRHGGKVWLTSRVPAEVTCLHCKPSSTSPRKQHER